MRNLVTIQKVREVSAIPDSDFLELARIMGWQCVVKKGEFREGDIGVYFEVDSFLPVKPLVRYVQPVPAIESAIRSCQTSRRR
jgi:RNA ligase (TIGR02306 family)